MKKEKRKLEKSGARGRGPWKGRIRGKRSGRESQNRKPRLGGTFKGGTESRPKTNSMIQAMRVPLGFRDWRVILFSSNPFPKFVQFLAHAGHYMQSEFSAFLRLRNVDALRSSS